MDTLNAHCTVITWCSWHWDCRQWPASSRWTLARAPPSLYELELKQINQPMIIFFLLVSRPGNHKPTLIPLPPNKEKKKEAETFPDSSKAPQTPHSWTSVILVVSWRVGKFNSRFASSLTLISHLKWGPSHTTLPNLFTWTNTHMPPKSWSSSTALSIFFSVHWKPFRNGSFPPGSRGDTGRSDTQGTRWSLPAENEVYRSGFCRPRVFFPVLTRLSTSLSVRISGLWETV